MTDYIVGAIGWPIEHSLSPAMHNAAFAALGLTNWRYEKMAVPPDVLRHSLNEFRNHGLIGINVTIPHKRAVMPFVKCDAQARAVGAVNTIDFRTNIGTNTDVAGFMDDLAAHGVEVRGMRAIVLGAGGAARAAVYGLVQAGANVAILNRSPEHAVHLINEMGVNADLAILESLRDADLIVNATPVGMSPHVDASPVPDDAVLSAKVILYDMIYRPARTRLMAQVEAAGGVAVGGLGMLARQGAAAFTLWTSVAAPVETMLQAARAALAERS
ncbi:MAG: shikimate dehydrogenase [Anaerolineae bacterium]|nr:shikimate dehydrogenase [Anaerolineae bacterium]NUQ02263.1 shikimate dehydrogenase [Anaerolineae bacterium]